MIPHDPSVSVRAALPADVPQVLGFIRELAVYERLEHVLVATEAGLMQALFGPRPCAEVAFVCLDGEPMGFALWFYNFSTFRGQRGLYLEDLFVRPAARGHGLGRALLRHLARVAVEQGCGRMEWLVLTWNEPAIGFYRRLGAQPLEDVRTFRLSGPALVDLAAQPD